MIALLLLAAFALIGLGLLFAIGLEYVDADELEVPTLTSRIAVFFMFPWLIILMAGFTLIEEDGTAEDLWEYIESMLRFVWLGEAEDDSID